MRAASRALMMALTIVLPPALGHAQRPQVETVEHTIAKGDTCAGIARKFYNDGTRWDIIHEFNPRLGPSLPHRLVPGETLTLPPTLPPDAWVTGVVRRVDHRPDSADDWSPTSRGTALEVGFRVSTHARSAAELTFRDDSMVELQQNTLLVLYGHSASQARTRPNAVRLARGTLKSRLAALRGEGGPRLEITSAAAVASIAAGDALVAVGGDGASAVSNHAGGAVNVRSVGVKGAVDVVPGMGTRVEKGKVPEPPRPLPPAPAWSGTEHGSAWGATPQDAALSIAWAPVEAASRWRLELERDGKPFAASDLPLTPRKMVLKSLPAGRYAVRMITIDGDGLIGLPSTPHAFTVSGVESGAEVPVGTVVRGCAAPDSRAPAVEIPAGSTTVQCAGRQIEIVGVNR